MRRLCVVGGGWAGLATAVEATSAGHAVTLIEMAPQLGGRARRVPPAPRDPPGLAFDNGQHIMIGAYSETLRLMRLVGIDVAAAFDRRPLTLRFANGDGISLPTGAAVPAFVRGVLTARAWPMGERLALLRAAAGWLLRGFHCPPSWTVAELTAALPRRVRDELMAPLCVAALNTPAEQASATVFLRVLRDALFTGRGAADLLLPRVDLSTLWPDAAGAWLQARGANLRLGTRVNRLQGDASGWRVDGEQFDAVVLACSAVEAARLAEPHATGWAELARALQYEPIVTVLIQSAGTRLALPMLALRNGLAQYVFDLGQLRGTPCAEGVLAAVISGASAAIDHGLERSADEVRQQLQSELGSQLAGMPEVLRVLSEKRATFLCTPELVRPHSRIGPRLRAAGDYVEGPYPATLEGAVRSGVAAGKECP